MSICRWVWCCALAARGAVSRSGRRFDPKAVSRMLDAVADSSVSHTVASSARFLGTLWSQGAPSQDPSCRPPYRPACRDCRPALRCPRLCPSSSLTPTPYFENSSYDAQVSRAVGSQRTSAHDGWRRKRHSRTPWSRWGLARGDLVRSPRACARDHALIHLAASLRVSSPHLPQVRKAPVQLSARRGLPKMHSTGIQAVF